MQEKRDDRRVFFENTGHELLRVSSRGRRRFPAVPSVHPPRDNPLQKHGQLRCGQLHAVLFRRRNGKGPLFEPFVAQVRMRVLQVPARVLCG